MVPTQQAWQAPFAPSQQQPCACDACYSLIYASGVPALRARTSRSSQSQRCCLKRGQVQHGCSGASNLRPQQPAAQAQARPPWGSIAPLLHTLLLANRHRRGMTSVAISGVWATRRWRGYFRRGYAIWRRSHFATADAYLLATYSGSGVAPVLRPGACALPRRHYLASHPGGYSAVCGAAVHWRLLAISLQPGGGFAPRAACGYLQISWRYGQFKPAKACLPSVRAVPMRGRSSSTSRATRCGFLTKHSAWCTALLTCNHRWRWRCSAASSRSTTSRCCDLRFCAHHHYPRPTCCSLPGGAPVLSGAPAVYFAIVARPTGCAVAPVVYTARSGVVSATPPRCPWLIPSASCA